MKSAKYCISQSLLQLVDVDVFFEVYKKDYDYKLYLKQLCVSTSGILVVSVDVKHDVYLLTATVSVTCIHVHIPLSQILRCSEEARLPHTFTPDFAVQQRNQNAQN